MVGDEHVRMDLAGTLGINGNSKTKQLHPWVWSKAEGRACRSRYHSTYQQHFRKNEKRMWYRPQVSSCHVQNISALGENLQDTPHLVTSSQPLINHSRCPWRCPLAPSLVLSSRLSACKPQMLIALSQWPALCQGSLSVL